MSRSCSRPELRAYEGYLARVRRAPGTCTRYLSELEPFLDWLGERSFGAPSRVEIDEYLDLWHDNFERRNGRVPAAATTRLHYTALRSFYGFLESRECLLDDAGGTAPNRFSHLDAPRRVQKPIDWLRPDEDAAILAYFGTPNERFVVQLLRWTGIRAGEAQSLRICDIDLTAGAEQLQIRESKTPSGIRQIPLAPEFLPELNKWLAHQSQRSLAYPNAPLLATSHGTPMHHSYIWRVVKRVAYKAGVREVACTCGSPRSAYHGVGCPRTASGENLSDVEPHTLRRTYATTLLNSGASLHVVSRLLGHSSVAVTQQHYAEILDVTVRDEYMRALGYRTAA
jgi:integrase